MDVEFFPFTGELPEGATRPAGIFSLSFGERAGGEGTLVLAMETHFPAHAPHPRLLPMGEGVRFAFSGWLWAKVSLIKISVTVITIMS
ncbi:MAG: hypothetical protein COA84_05775 [Robiginitomaculum sp.]|nr:MAG: hypothetical protein COA84_05775 [Robiginitomaculum sp.]